VTDDAIPPLRKFRWPILVVLDEIGEEDEILEFQGRVAERLGLAVEAVDAPDPDTGRPLVTERLIRAMEDLYQADALDTDEDAGRFWITDVGRRFTQTEAEDLPESPREADVDAAFPTPTAQKPSIGDWIAALLYGLGP